MEINIPEIVAEVRTEFERYEKALHDGNVAELIRLFWDSAETLRYGPREIHYGHAAIAEFRRTRHHAPRPRTLRNTKITTFGRDFAVANTEYVPEGSTRIGRQSQSWARLPEGWRIVSAHVSFQE